MAAISSSFPTVGQVAFVTSTVLAIAAGAAILGAVTVTSTVAAVALAILGIALGGAGLASMTAYFDSRSTNPSRYFENLKTHAGIAIVALFQFTIQAVIQGLIQGVAGGVQTRVHNRIAY
jgi:hypothetical protein